MIRRRLICLFTGHRWATRVVTWEVWPQHRGTAYRECVRCLKRPR